MSQKEYRERITFGNHQRMRRNIGTLVNPNWITLATDEPGFERVHSHGHKWPPPKGAPLADHGGHFEVYRKAVSGSSVRLPPSYTFWDGSIGPGNQTGFSWTSPSFVSGSNLASKGASFVARALPNNPAFDLVTFLGELTEGVPRVIGSAAKRNKDFGSLGDEFLNVEFGWIPFVNDIRTFAATVRNSKRIMDQYVAGSGTHIRRRRSDPTTFQYQSVDGEGFVFPSQLNMGWNCTSEETISTSTWFSGSFMYHIPIRDGDVNKWKEWEAKANHLLGIRITPAALFQLTPWSWALDWFTNASDVMKNVTLLGSDGMVMQYGYVMEHKRYSMLRYGKTKTSVSHPTSFPLVYRQVTEQKKRVAANPYGFLVDDLSLSAAQTAVLAALGLSKGARSSRAALKADLNPFS